MPTAKDVEVLTQRVEELAAAVARLSKSASAGGARPAAKAARKAVPAKAPAKAASKAPVKRAGRKSAAA